MAIFCLATDLADGANMTLQHHINQAIKARGVMKRDCLLYTSLSGIEPSAVVVVATVRARKHHGGCPKAELGVPSLEYLEAGSANLARHVENLSLIHI